MSKFGVAPAEDVSGIVDGEIRRIHLGTHIVIEIDEDSVEGFPGLVFDTEDEAAVVATREATDPASAPSDAADGEAQAHR